MGRRVLMKFKLIKKTITRVKHPRMSFTKAGYLNLNGAAVEKYGIKLGHYVCLIQDEDKPNDFYLLISEDQNHSKLRENSQRTGLMVGYIDAKNYLKDHFKLEDTGFTVNLGGVIKTELGSALCLITSSLMKKGGSNG